MMAYKNTQPEPLVERQPPSGSLYAQMLFCDGKLSLRCSQKARPGREEAKKRGARVACRLEHNAAPRAVSRGARRAARLTLPPPASCGWGTRRR